MAKETTPEALCRVEEGQLPLFEFSLLGFGITIGGGEGWVVVTRAHQGVTIFPPGEIEPGDPGENFPPQE